MERKTKTLTTPSGVSVEMKEFISAGEFLDLNEESEKQSLTKTQLAKRLLEQAIVTLAGSAENIGSRLRELSISDYTFLQNEVKKLIEGDFSTAKSLAA
jgi:hypothetical protein